MKSKLVVISVLVAALFSGYGLVNDVLAQKDGKVASLIRNLWSADESLRKTTKRQLRKLGPTAIQPLLNLLEELKNDPQLRFESGKEAEGEAAYKAYLEAKNNNRSEESREYWKKLYALDITARLRNDLIELLGDLQGEEAIPYLIIDMQRQPIVSKVRWCASMEALVKIGSPAVLNLLELFSFWINREPEARDSFTLRRIAMILAEIGDPRALPVLENVKPDDPILYIDPEIKKLRIKLQKRVGKKL